MKHFYFGWIGKRKPYYHDTGINDTRLCWVAHSQNVDYIKWIYFNILWMRSTDTIFIILWYLEDILWYISCQVIQLHNPFNGIGFKGLLSNYLVICDKHFLKLAMWSNSMLQNKIVITYISRNKISVHKM